MGNTTNVLVFKEPPDANYKVSKHDGALLYTSATDRTYTLESAADVYPVQYTFKSTGTGTLTIEGALSETIDGELNVTLNQNDSISIVSDGTNWIIINNMSTTQKPFDLAVAEGSVSGYSKVNKFGEAIDCDSGVKTDIWDGANGSLSTDIWSPPTQARTHQITSTSTNDTSAGTGARTIKVYGLTDWDTAEVNETITMNGTSNVATANNYVIIHRMKAVTWGSSGVNEDDITATADTDSTITAAILTGQNQTQMMIYGIPSTQSLQVKQFLAEIVKGTGSSQRADGEILWMPDPATNVVDNTAWTNKENFLLVEANNPWKHTYELPKSFSGAGIIKIQVTSNSNGTKAIGAMDAYVVDN